jgi:hypothetical protein
MPLIPAGGQPRTFALPKLTGGLCTTQAQDNECAVFENLEATRNGWVQTRAGTTLLHAQGALGSQMVVGLGMSGSSTGGIAPVAGTSNQRFIVAKTGTTFYYTTPTRGAVLGAVAFSTFTVPAAPGDNVVRFESGYDKNLNSVSFMSCVTWPNIVVWDGSASTASYLTGSPSGVTMICWHQNCLVAVTGSNTILNSDPLNPTNWPTAYKNVVDVKYGAITNLFSIDDRLYIFTESAILYLEGDITQAPHFTVMHPELGAHLYLATQYTSSIAFGQGGNYYILSGSVNLISDAIRDQAPTPPNSFIAMNSEYLYVRPGRNTSTASPKVPTTDVQTDLYLNERIRYGYWTHHTYPSASYLGASNPYYGLVFYAQPPWNFFILPTGSGDLMVQFTPERNTYTTDAPSIAITSQFTTRPMDLGDRVLTKQLRRGMMYGTGSNVSVTATMTDTQGVVRTATPTLSSTTLPSQFTTLLLDGTSASAGTEFNEIQINLSGQNLLLQDLRLDYKTIRYNFLNFA